LVWIKPRHLVSGRRPSDRTRDRRPNGRGGRKVV
jgi:hypothetical protein